MLCKECNCELRVTKGINFEQDGKFYRETTLECINPQCIEKGKPIVITNELEVEKW